MTQSEKIFFTWLKKNNPAFYRYFWELMKTNDGLGAHSPPSDASAVSSGGLIDRARQLAELYYQTQLQKIELDAAADAARANANPVTQTSPPLSGFRIDPTTGFIGIAALLGLWALTRTTR